MMEETIKLAETDETEKQEPGRGAEKTAGRKKTLPAGKTADTWKIIRLEKPADYMGMKIESLDLSGMDDLTLDDMIEIYNLYESLGGTGTVFQESSLLFAKLTAQRLTGIPLEALGKIGAKDAVKLKNRVYRFFFLPV